MAYKSAIWRIPLRGGRKTNACAMSGDFGGKKTKASLFPRKKGHDFTRKRHTLGISFGYLPRPEFGGGKVLEALEAMFYLSKYVFFKELENLAGRSFMLSYLSYSIMLKRPHEMKDTGPLHLKKSSAQTRGM